MCMRRLARGIWVAATAVALIVAGAAAAFAQAYPGGGKTPPEVGGEQFFPGKIPKTGTDVLLFILIALLAIIAGIALRRATRRAARSDD